MTYLSVTVILLWKSWEVHNQICPSTKVTELEDDLADWPKYFSWVARYDQICTQV